MANYCCTIRTNYFHVKDEDAFRKMMEQVYGCEDSVDLWEEKDSKGNTVFSFGIYGGISGLRDPEDEDEDDDIAYDRFIDRLQQLVADDDAIIIVEAGNEKLRYVVGSATIITSKGYQYTDIEAVAVQQAREALANDGWDTKLCY